jgi:hypothetical protein
MAHPPINPKLAAGLLFAGAACCTAPVVAAFLVLAGAGALVLDHNR